MSDKPFVHLHLHTSYSLLDGACRIKDLTERVAELGQPAVAVTDHGVMYGLVEFAADCQKKGIKPILGSEVYIVPRGTRFDRDAKVPNSHLVLLAENDAGYHNLAKLSSKAHLEGFYYKPRIDKDLLAQHSEGLICLSSCLQGEVTSLLADSQLEAAERAAGFYADVFGKDRFFIEMQNHGIAEQKAANINAKKLARRMGLRLVATNDVHYLRQEHAAAHEILMALQTGTVLSDPKRFRYNSTQFYLKSRAEMETLFPDCPEALDITLEIAERCNATIEMGKLHFPVFPVPPEFGSSREFLAHLAGNSLQNLYGLKDYRNPADAREREIIERFNHELDIIDRTGFNNYFLVVRDFVNFAHESGIPVGPGRGSGGGSIVAYACGITGIDPLQYNLIFERFLNPERVSPPDFDIDFCQSRRGEVIDYVKNRYGEDHVAQIITFGSLGARNVIRDVGRVLEIPYGRCTDFTKLVPEIPNMTLAKAREQSPEFDELCRTDDELQRIMQSAEVLEGLYRNPGVHAAGVVIGEKPLIDIVPLGRDKDGQPVTQYAKGPVEAVGLLKMDFLGLETLTILEETVSLVHEFQGKQVDLTKIDMQDAKTYQMLSRADTVGVFQLESGGMRRLIREIGIGNIEDLVAVIALYRPGPMEMLPLYCARKKGEAAVAYDHPLLEPILKDTYGVMVYQEQVQKAATVLAGYSLGQSDILRRAMGKKDADVMEKERHKFIAGCAAANNIGEELAGRIFDNIAAFAGYGFNKAHSVGYGIVSYQTAFMKANYPAEFMSATISAKMGNSEKMAVPIYEANAMGFTILPPDVNHSLTRFVPEGDGIRFGLAGVKGVGEGAARNIVEERQARGAFTTLEDFLARVDTTKVNKRAIESLARCGAMDAFGMHRSQLFNGIEDAMNHAAAKRRDLAAGQTSLFDMLDDGNGDAGEGAAELPDCPRWNQRIMLAHERELLGIYVSGHPLTRYRYLASKFTTLDQVEQLTANLRDDEEIPVRLFALVNGITKRFDKRKRPWAIVTLENEKADGMEALVFAEAYANCGERLQPDTPTVLCGALSMRDGKPSLVTREAYGIEEAMGLFAKGLRIAIEEDKVTKKMLAELRDILASAPGTTPVTLVVDTKEGQAVKIDLPETLTVRIDEEMLKTLAGIDSLSVQLALKDDIYLQNNRRRQWRASSTR